MKGSLAVLFAVVVSGAISGSGCGGATVEEIAPDPGGGLGGAGAESGDSGGGVSGAPSKTPCEQPGAAEPCDCPGYEGIRFCDGTGHWAACVCTGGPGYESCSIAAQCAGCTGCMPVCVCNTGDPEECLGCYNCERGSFPISRNCANCPYRVLPTQVCFDDRDDACACACDGKPGKCVISDSCPAEVRCE
jgi:hypothetical protein